MKTRTVSKWVAVLLVVCAAASAYAYFLFKDFGKDAPKLILTGSRHDFRSLVFSPDSKLVAASQIDGSLRIWEVATGAEWYLFSPNDPRSAVSVLAFSPDGQTLACVSGKDTVALFDLKTKAIRDVIQGHESEITTLAFHPNRTTLATGTHHGVVRFWNMVKLGSQVVFKTKLTQPGFTAIQALAFDAAGETLAVGIYGDLIILDVRDGVEERATVRITDLAVNSLAFTADGKILARGGNSLVLWANGASEKMANYSRHPGDKLAWSPDRKKLAVGIITGEYRPTYLEIWDLDGPRPIHRFISHDGPANQVAWSPDGQTLATAGSDGTVRLWEVAAILENVKN